MICTQVTINNLFNSSCPQHGTFTGQECVEQGDDFTGQRAGHLTADKRPYRVSTDQLLVLLMAQVLW